MKNYTKTSGCVCNSLGQDQCKYHKPITPPRPPEGKQDRLLELCLPLTISDEPGDLRITGELHDAICSMAYHGSEFWDDAMILPHKKQALSYARRIVTAVNLHAQLVEALEELVNVVDPPGLKTGVQLEDYFIEPVKKARTLLREAAK